MDYSTQADLVWLIEKWKHQLDKNGFANGLLMDLSEAFGTIKYKLLITKLHVCGFWEKCFRFSL